MKLISFLARYSPWTITMAILAGIISGASNAALLAIFNATLKKQGAAESAVILGFVALCLFLPLTRFISEVSLTRLAQGALFDLRLRFSRRILAAPLRHLEAIGPHRLMVTLADDIPVITNTLTIMPVLCINIAIAVSGLVYLGFLSRTVLLIVLGFVTLGITTYQIPILKAVHSFRLAGEQSDTLFKHFRGLTDGAKELKLHRRRREAFLSESLQATAASVRQHNVIGMTIYTAATSWGQILVFVVIGLVLFALPNLAEIDKQTLTGYTITLLYLMTPLQVIMNTVPNISRASVALKRVEDLGIELESAGSEDASPSDPEPARSPLRIDLIGVTHAYRREAEEDNFLLGPINMSLASGELVFLTGGNGSGKTTLAKLLMGLYVPESGEIRLNGEKITNLNREFYRQHFSVVFSDYFLFESLLGLDSPGLDESARSYLSKLQLDHKVKIQAGTFSTTELSQGQRKRLALVTAYLEDRPIYIFDEWAADQDPFFKNIFYNQLLPDLKRKGKALLVISHDDKYYSVADRVIKLDSGNIDCAASIRPARMDEEMAAPVEL
jgi:putative pyoverdin transport system ATP-binding/permease protein